MAIPTDKAPPIDAFIQKVTGKDRRQTIAEASCMTCNGAADQFRDELSRREYAISGMCQECQDGVFGAGEEE